MALVLAHGNTGDVNSDHWIKVVALVLARGNTGDVNSDHWIKVVSATVLHRKVNFFSFVI